MSVDRHRVRKLSNLKATLWGGIAIGVFFCVLPAALILPNDYVGGGTRGGRIIRRQADPAAFYCTFGFTLTPGVALIGWSIYSYFRRKKADL